MNQPWTGSVRWGLAILGAVLLLALLAPLLASAPELQIDPARSRTLAPLTRVWWVDVLDDTGRLETLVCEDVRDVGTPGAPRVEIRHGGKTLVLQKTSVQRARRHTYWLGTDRLGRDVFSRVLFGARTSLLVAAAAATLALTLGVLVGGCAALARPEIDGLLMRFVDAALAFPQLLLVLFLSTLFAPGIMTLILIVGLTSWMGLSRLVRAELRGLKRRAFVRAAEGLGATPWQVLTRHLLPNGMTPILVATSLIVGDAILLEAAISFLGLGTPPAQPSWGRMIAEGRSDIVGAWWMAAWPGALLALTIISLHLVADGLRDALDPRYRIGPSRLAEP